MFLRSLGGIAIVLIIGTLLASCIPGLPSLGGGGGTSGTLVYSGPTEVRLTPGETLLPTDIVFLGAEGNRGRFIIGDLKATRQIGDSLDWDGEPLPGVNLQLRLRVLWFKGGNVQLGGTVRVEVSDVQPSPDGIDPNAAVTYGVPVSYRVPVNQPIPGTTWKYVGPTDRGAELSGMDEYPYRKLADSILWEGRLRPDVGLTLNVRVVRFDERSLRVAGLATIALAVPGAGAGSP
ncbi:MAG: hypothetical protein GXP39_03440 [Chloroflexi bacterium]|nr:hypothetical protein [Chloroflexota bacterium]